MHAAIIDSCEEKLLDNIFIKRAAKMLLLFHREKLRI